MWFCKLYNLRLSSWLEENFSLHGQFKIVKLKGVRVNMKSKLIGIVIRESLTLSFLPGYGHRSLVKVYNNVSCLLLFRNILMSDLDEPV